MKGRSAGVLAWVFGVFVLAVLSRFAAAETAAPEEVMRAIERNLQAQQNAEAIELAEQALRKYASDPRLWVLKGIAEDRGGKPAEALQAFRKSLALSPEYLPALEGAAQLEYQLHDPNAAASLRKILRIRPDDPTANAMRAVLAFQQNDCTVAVEHFAKAGSAIDSQGSALTQYGTCLLRLKRPETAIPVFQAVLDRAPRDAHARQNLSAAQFAAKQYANALATLQPALAEKQPDAGVLDLASAIAEAQGDTPKAVEWLRSAIVSDPKTARYYLDFASLCFDHASYDIGIHMLDVGLSQIPQSAPLYLTRGILYVQQGKYEQAEADFERAAALDPQQTFSPFAEGLVQYQQSNLSGALERVRQQLTRHPDDASSLFLFGEILLQKGAEPGTPEFDEASSALQHALKLNPDNIQAHDTLGNVYLKSGNLSKAIEQSRLALKLDSSDQTALYHLIVALRRLNRKDEIPPLLKQMAAIRNTVGLREAERNRYRLYESNEH